MTDRGAGAAAVWTLLLSAVLPPREAGAQAARAEGPAGAGRVVPLALRRHHHTVWPLGEVAPLGRQALMVRSPDGYLWLSGRAGVVRFDGVRFSVLTGRHAAALRSTRASARNFAVRTVDRDGRMWITRPDGALLTYANGTFRVAMDAPPEGTYYFGPLVDGAGGLWVVVDSSGDVSAGGKLVDGRLRRDAWPAGAPRTGIRGIVPDTADGMWIGTDADGVWHVTPRGSRRYALPAALDASAGDRSARPLLQSRDGALWLLVPDMGLVRMRDGVWSPVRLRRDVRLGAGLSAVEAPDGTVYIASRGAGVLRWSADHVERMLPGEGAGGVVYDVRLDDEGSLWASTDAGLERFRRTPFAQVVRTDGAPSAPTFELAADDDGRLWVSEREGALHRVDGADARRPRERLTMTRVPLPPESATSQFSILRGAARGVWMARSRGGLLHVDRDGATAFGREAGLPAQRIWNAEVDAGGALWLSVLPRGTGRFLGRRYDRVAFPGGGPERHGAFRADDARRSVVFADDREPAAFAVDPAGSFRRLDRDVPLPLGVGDPVIEGRDTVWVVRGHPLALVRVANGRAATLRFDVPVDALPGLNAQLVVAGGWLWFGSSMGVGRFALAPLHRAADGGAPAPAPQTFGSLDGVAMPRLADYGLQRMVRAPDGRIWISTPAGLAVVDPAAVPANPVAPRVHVEEVVVDGRPLAGADRSGAAARVAANPGRVEVHFTALGLRMPERVRLEYRLDGVDPGWQPSRGPRVATYTQLRPGRYRFRVRAWNEDGVPSAGEARLALSVLPAWYQTGWASVAGLLAVAGAGAAGAGAVARARRRRADATAQATVAERVRVARELHDTLLGDLAGLAMQLEVVTAQVELATPTAVALPVLRGLRDQAHRSLDEARHAVTAMRRRSGDDVPLWAQLGEAARRVFAGTDVDVRVEHAGRPVRCAPAVEAELLRIATEAITNARKHAACRTITVTCVAGHDAVRVRVSDDGVGFDPRRGAEEGHWGLVGMRERAAAIRATLGVESASGRGTTVLIIVPADSAVGS